MDANLIALLAPVLLIHLTLVVIALRDLIRRDHTRGPKWLWVIVILFVNVGIGPVIYLVFGRED
jgi:hypothetical protein